MTGRTGWLLLVVANVLFCCVLSFYQTTAAAPQDTPQEPFANSVAQRIEMVNELREIKNLLKEQNALLSSGSLKVVVSDPQKR